MLAAGTSALAAVRPARKPLHPQGDLRTGRLRRAGSTVRTGVSWIDEPGEDEVVVRLSRAIGLPPRLPDIHGLALRVPSPDGPGDLLFASTGWGRLTRFLLTGGRRPRSRPMTTLLPYDAPAGPVLLGIQGGPTPESYELRWARAAGPWHPFAVLELHPDTSEDGPVSFDPVRHQIPGLRQYDVVRRLRAPAYRRARAARADRPSPTTEESARVH